jgi:hypothetical protein
MGTRGLTGRFLAGVMVLLLGGCGPGATGASSAAAPTATPLVVGTPTPTPSATTVPSGPVTYGSVTVVAGTGTCPTAELGNATTDADGATHYRGGRFVCRATTDDPRVDGTETASWSLDLWGTTQGGAAVQWGPVRLENSGGAWEGRATGVASLPGRGDIIVIWYEGTGGYAGLSYFELWTGQEPWTIQGQIFPGSPPTP